jgi:putative hemolysin
MVLNWTNDRTLLLVAALLIGIFVTAVFRQILPRLFMRDKPERKLLVLLPVVRPLYSLATILTSPFAGFFTVKENSKIDTTVNPDSADDDDSNDEGFQALMEVGEAEGIFEEDERELIESVVEFSDTRAGEIMTPRTEICGIAAGTTVRAARDVMIEEKYSRLPVYRDSIDNIEGIIYVRDLLTAWASGNEDEPIDGMLRDVYLVPETKSAAELLKTMQVEHVQIAIVIDEYGGVAGIVTLEDIIEEIVGEIEDEDIEDEEIIEIVEGEDGYYDVLGSTEIDKIERLFDVELEDDDYTTVAGMVTSEAGYVPKQDEQLVIRGLNVTILRAEEKRINLLRLRLADPNAEETSDDAATHS